jgi:hypothetical protein
MQPFIAAQMRSRPASSSSRDISALLVGPLHLGDRQAALCRHGEHLLGVREGIRHLSCRLSPACHAPSWRCNSSSETTKPPPIE